MDYKLLINVSTMYLLLCFSAYHLSIFLGRQKKKNQIHNVYFSLSGFAYIFYIINLEYLVKENMLTRFGVPVTVFIVFFFVILTMKKIINFSKTGNILFMIIIILLISSIIISTPIFFLRENWYELHRKYIINQE